MKILAFDTSAEACSVGLLESSSQAMDEMKTLHHIAPRQQTKLILPMVNELLAAACLSLNQLDAIACTTGPGSFTGIRIACSVAQGLAFAARLPIIQISSLAATAQANFLQHGCKKLLVAANAYQHQIYWACYTVTDQRIVKLIDEEKVCKPDAVPLLEESEKWYGVGEGWQLYQDKLTKRLEFIPEAIYFSPLPLATALLSLAKDAYQTGDMIQAQEVLPTYLRKGTDVFLSGGEKQ